MGFLRNLKLWLTPPRMTDPDFGKLIFMHMGKHPERSYWECEWTLPATGGVVLITLRGGESGPSTDARQFYLALPARYESILKACRPRLEQVFRDWRIPKEALRTARFSPFWNESLEQRFRLWDVATGKTIATSPLIFPRLNLTVEGRNEGLDPSLELSANGQAVLVFWKSAWNEILPIYVFSEAPVGTAPTTY
jgi:hypothetical protein